MVPVHENLLFDLSGMTNPQCTTTVTLTKHQVKLYNAHSTKFMMHNGKLHETQHVG